MHAPLCGGLQRFVSLHSPPDCFTSCADFVNLWPRQLARWLACHWCRLAPHSSIHICVASGFVPQAHASLKVSLYDVETLAQAARGLHVEDKIAAEVSVLREAFARLQATKKVCLFCEGWTCA